MIIEQLMPSKSPTMTEGTIVAWRIKPGDKVKVGDVIAELQTDKSVTEWESPDGGICAEIIIPAGDVALVNQVVAIFTTKAGEDIKEALTKAKAKNQKIAASISGAAPAVAAPVATAPIAAPAPVAAKPSAPAALPKGVRISPVAAKVAAALGVDVRQVKGSGPDGRIVRRDVEAAAKSGSAKIGVAAGKPTKPKLKVLRPDGTGADVAMSPMRQIIGKRLLEAKTQIPHFYVSESIDAGALVAMREQINVLEGMNVTINDLIVRASALALRAHPKVNATFHGNSIKQYDSADISVAVAIPDGLITPIVTKAHAKSVKQIGEEVRALAKKAVEGKLQPVEFQGGSFTISNLGMFGISEFVAIINPPQVAILAVAGIKDEAVVKHGQLVAGKVMRVTLSADHRAVDGADAAAFLKTLRELLEAPATLLV